ncbi:sodium/potassium/calcium exchanger 2-like isoform X2 [Gigantopelta aegis]|uniref:sodium/potassium/calcium exchanger 2-like isoform X2 n=1 Tax=Gigantopelta aegis TaxID=1735272 RepID=UPI001B88BCD3|nr:sodium/potassium/calcium exchanger 2-like isoform X2 [Gigantopelta aegis]
MSYLRLHRLIGKRCCCLRMIVFISVCVFGYLVSVFLVAGQITADSGFSSYTNTDHNFVHRMLLSSDGNATLSRSNYPQDILSLVERQKGAVVLHICGMIYMFVALAIVCDEFFVPSLEVITEKLDISADVAGATFMAAGGSAPELFTSFIGVFISQTDVGIGTIVGSAVFNILFVIGMCAVFSKDLLKLTWWPLFRDVTFYSFDLILLIVFFADEMIQWWESLILLCCYFSYVTFMKYNHHIESGIKKFMKRNAKNKVASSDALMNRVYDRRCSQPILHCGGCRYRHGVLQIMIHTLDPLGEVPENGENGRGSHHSHHSHHIHHSHSHHSRQIHQSHQSLHQEDEHQQDHQYDNRGHECEDIEEGADAEKALHLHSLGVKNYQGDDEAKMSAKQNGYQGTSPINIQVISNGKIDSPVDSQANESPALSQNTQDTLIDKTAEPTGNQQNGDALRRDDSDDAAAADDGDDASIESDERPELEEEEKPIDLSWPDSHKKRITYIIVAPIMFSLWFTLPDVRVPKKKKWFYVTFIGSILWIAFFSYLMVWWANQTGETVGITPEIMGLTILAAGTSIPDLITSVIVAKKGYGDMAVSSSVGSNIFDITVGLPLPWVIFSSIYGGIPYSVTSRGLLCSIILLFLMLLILIITIAACKWKLSRRLVSHCFICQAKLE